MADGSRVGIKHRLMMQAKEAIDKQIEDERKAEAALQGKLCLAMFTCTNVATTQRCGCL